MKNLILVVFIIASSSIRAQVTITETIVEVCNFDYQDDSIDPPIGTYFKDINNTFAPFLGTWQYINGNEVITFKIEKVTHFYDAEFQVYEDFLVGNYNYSQDGGTTLSVDRITPTLQNENSMANSMYSPCAIDSPNKLGMTFRDVLLDKGFGLISFEFLPGSTTQMQVSLSNEPGSYGRLEGTPAHNFNFSLPTSFVVTKQ